MTPEVIRNGIMLAVISAISIVLAYLLGRSDGRKEGEKLGFKQGEAHGFKLGIVEGSKTNRAIIQAWVMARRDYIAGRKPQKELLS